MNKIAVLLIALSALLTGVSQAQVTKCQDASGKTVYSDHACGESGQSVRNLDSNTIANQQVPGQMTERRQDNAGYRTAANSNCPTEQEIMNLETSANSIAYRDKREEREFMQAEVRRARACSKEGGNYSKDDWKRIQEGQAAQGSITLDSRRSGRDLAEGIHASAASAQEQERMRTDKLAEAERAFQKRGQPAPKELTSCDSGGCLDSRGTHYSYAAGGNFIRSDGRLCTRAGESLRCD